MKSLPKLTQLVSVRMKTGAPVCLTQRLDAFLLTMLTSCSIPIISCLGIEGR